MGCPAGPPKSPCQWPDQAVRPLATNEPTCRWGAQCRTLVDEFGLTRRQEEGQMKRTILIGATCAVLGGAGVAGAQTTHILGRDGPTVPLDAMCHREVAPAPGEVMAAFVEHPGPAPGH